MSPSLPTAPRSPRTAKVAASPPSPSSPQGSVPGRGGHLGGEGLTRASREEGVGGEGHSAGFQFFSELYALWSVNIRWIPSSRRWLEDEDKPPVMRQMKTC